ncbi:MarR family transcriptional regulator [Saccharothrix sp. NPDC042600]|uniref:MarR family transcriptional regulator n=1 Tax=Saccharothrix TaxID=2071 RepID=UPI0033D22127|nr:MarR family winged helix-turn-helix transcriptional regulator [Saccharothrix mutabilis subsp. capreolus]
MKPIGYWLKHLDALIDAAFDNALAATDLTRRHWQLLNEARAGALPDDPLVPDLVERGWVADGRLTEAGEQTVHATASRVDGVRTTLMTGLTAEDYAATIATLEKMAANLEKTAGAGAARHNR